MEIFENEHGDRRGLRAHRAHSANSCNHCICMVFSSACDCSFALLQPHVANRILRGWTCSAQRQLGHGQKVLHVGPSTGYKYMLPGRAKCQNRPSPIQRHLTLHALHHAARTRHGCFPEPLRELSKRPQTYNGWDSWSRRNNRPCPLLFLPTMR